MIYPKTSNEVRNELARTEYPKPDIRNQNDQYYATDVACMEREAFKRGFDEGCKYMVQELGRPAKTISAKSNEE